MPLCTSTGPVLATNGMFTGKGSALSALIIPTDKLLGD